MGTGENYWWVIHPSELAASSPGHTDGWMGDATWKMTAYCFCNEKRCQLEKVDGDGGWENKNANTGKNISSHSSLISFSCPCFPPPPYFGMVLHQWSQHEFCSFTRAWNESLSGSCFPTVSFLFLPSQHSHAFGCWSTVQREEERKYHSLILSGGVFQLPLIFPRHNTDNVNWH